LKRKYIMSQILKQAMRDAGVLVSEGADLEVNDYQSARDFLFFRGINIGEDFYKYDALVGTTPAPAEATPPAEAQVVEPVVEAPVDAPVVDAPAEATAPVVDVPVDAAPVVEVPVEVVAEAPVDTPVADAPVDAPVVDTPAPVDTPVEAAPVVDAA
jgi:hypothetical protein